MGLVDICTPFLLNTPLALFLVILFRNVTKFYEFRNNACFLSVMLRNLTDYVIIRFFAFRNVTELYGLRTNTSFQFPACHETSRIVLQCFLLTSGMSRNFMNCQTMGAKYLEVVKRGSHPDNGWSPDEIRV